MHRCSNVGEYDLYFPRQPNILDQLVTALHDAGLEANPRNQCRHGPDARHPGRRNPGIEDSNSSEEEEDDAPRVKIPPPYLKDSPENNLMLIC